jgi:hypothetical protein
MKKLLLTLAVIWSTQLNAQEYELPVTQDGKIIHNENDWQLAAQSNLFQLLVHKNSLGVRQRTVPVYSVTEFHNPAGQKYEMFQEPVYKIYTFGLLECHTALFNILNHWFVDKNNKIVYNELKPAGSYVIDMRANNTPRNDLYRLVCNK